MRRATSTAQRLCQEFHKDPASVCRGATPNTNNHRQGPEPKDLSSDLPPTALSHVPRVRWPMAVSLVSSPCHMWEGERAPHSTGASGRVTMKPRVNVQRGNCSPLQRCQARKHFQTGSDLPTAPGAGSTAPGVGPHPHLGVTTSQQVAESGPGPAFPVLQCLGFPLSPAVSRSPQVPSVRGSELKLESTNISTFKRECF